MSSAISLSRLEWNERRTTPPRTPAQASPVSPGVLLTAFSARRGRSGAGALGGGRIPRCAEFAVRGPVGPFARVGEAEADLVEQLGILGDSAPVPVGVPFVARLVIVEAVVLARECLAAGDAAVHQVETLAEADRRHTLLGEGEMVGSVEDTGLGMRVGGIVAALRLTCFNDVVDQVELGGAADGEILLSPDRLPRVDVQVRDGLADVV